MLRLLQVLKYQPKKLYFTYHEINRNINFSVLIYLLEYMKLKRRCDDYENTDSYIMSIMLNLNIFYLSVPQMRMKRNSAMF